MMDDTKIDTVILHGQDTCKCGKNTQRMFYENCKGHVEGHFLGGADRPRISGNFPDFCVEIIHKKLEVFQK